MLRIKFRLVVLAAVLTVVVLVVLSSQPAQAQGAPIKIQILLNLGGGSNQDQFEQQKVVAEIWNKTHSDIQVEFDQGCQHCTAQESYFTSVAAGFAPDIIGPISSGGIWRYAHTLADLTPYIEKDKNSLNLNGDELKALGIFTDDDDKIVALPVGIYPTAFLVNEDLFAAAKVPLPPTKWGEQYTDRDGNVHNWDWETLAMVGKQIAVDEAGKHPGEAGFDKTKIAAYGFSNLWSPPRHLPAAWGSPDAGLKNGKTATFNQPAYVNALKWLHKGIFEDYFIPDQTASNIMTIGSLPFQTGKIGMWYSQLWYISCCLEQPTFKWNAYAGPAVPGTNGKTIVAPINADAFAVPAKGKNKDAAWEVVKWLTSAEISPKLCVIYGCMPTRSNVRDEWVKQVTTEYPHLNTDVLIEAAQYQESPRAHHEKPLPNYNQSDNVLRSFYDGLRSDPEANSNSGEGIASKLKVLNEQLQAAFEATPAPNSYGQSYVPASPPPMTAEITSVAYAPDGKTILTGRDDGTARLWDAQTSKVLWTVGGDNDEDSEGAVQVAYSPDGTMIATGNQDGIVRLLDIKTGKLIRGFPEQSTEIVGLDFSADGKSLLTASYDGLVQLWDVNTGNSILSLTGHSYPTHSVALSPDGTLVAGGGVSNLWLWDVQTGEILRTFVTDGSALGELFSVAFSPDGKTILAGSSNDMAMLWDVESGQQLFTFAGHTDEVFDVEFSPDGTTLLTASCDRTVKLWDAKTGKELKTLSGHAEGVLSAAWSPDGKTIVTGSEDHTTRLWDVPQAATIRSFPAHIGYVESVVFSQDGKKLVTGGGDQKAMLWDVESGKLLQTFSGYESTIYTTAISPDGATVAGGGQDGSVQLWDAQSANPLRKLVTIYGTTEAIASISFTSDGKSVWTGSKDFSVYAWNRDSGAQVRALSQFGVGVYAMAFSADSLYVAAGDNSGKITIRELQGVDVLRGADGHKATITSLAFSPDSKLLASGSHNHEIGLWNVSTGSQRRIFSTGKMRPLSLTFSQDGESLLIGFANGVAQAWEVKTGEIQQVFTGHTEGVISVAFSPDGKRVATGSMDGTARIWDANTGAMLVELY